MREKASAIPNSAQKPISIVGSAYADSITEFKEHCATIISI
jgi:hypothetical protein